MAKTLHNKITIVQLLGSEICVYCSVKYAKMLWWQSRKLSFSKSS